jgi:soluble lytic murein transglycosylase-like protein
MNALKQLYRTICGIVKTIIVVGGMALALTGAIMVSGAWKPKPLIVEKEKIVEVERQERNLKELVQDIPPKYGIKPLLFAAIIERESGGKRDAVRFEPGQMDRAKKVSGGNESQQRMYASSFGVAQVMGYHAPKYGLSWADLLEPETNIEVACTILKDCLDRHRDKSKVKQVHAALACYNGSTVYADAVMSRLAGLLIEKEL